MRTMVIAVVLMLVPVFAWAGEDDLKQADQFFRQMEYEKALIAVTHALETASNEPEQLVDGYRIQGLCLSALGRAEESVMAFRRLLAIDPMFQLSRDVSPKLSPPFSRALSIDQKPISLARNSIDEQRAIIEQDLEIFLRADPLGMVRSVRLLFWGEDNKENKLERALTGPGKVPMNFPKETKVGKISYYLEAINKYGSVVSRLGSKEKPLELQLEAVAPNVAINRPPSDTTTAFTSREKPTGVLESEREKKAAGTPFYKTWWFWTVVGVAVAGAATGTAIAIAKGKESGSDTNSYSITIK